jgi:hypothetical protein
MRNISKARTRAPLVSSDPSNDTMLDCKRALDDKKRWIIDWPRVPAHQTKKCEISPKRGCAHLSSLRTLQTTLWYVVNKHLMVKNGEELTEIHLGPLLPNQILQNMSRTRTRGPLVSSGPSNETIVDCKWALDGKKRWRIDWPRVPAHHTRKCEISPKRGHVRLSSL